MNSYVRRVAISILPILLTVTCMSIMTLPVHAVHKSKIVSPYPHRIGNLYIYQYEVTNLAGPDNIIEVWIGKTPKVEVYKVFLPEGWKLDDWTNPNAFSFAWDGANPEHKIKPGTSKTFTVKSYRFPSEFTAYTKDDKNFMYQQNPAERDVVWAPDTWEAVVGGEMILINKTKLTPSPWMSPLILFTSIIILATTISVAYAKHKKKQQT